MITGTRLVVAEVFVSTPLLSPFQSNVDNMSNAYAVPRLSRCRTLLWNQQFSPSAPVCESGSDVAAYEAPPPLVWLCSLGADSDRSSRTASSVVVNSG